MAPTATVEARTMPDQVEVRRAAGGKLVASGVAIRYGALSLPLGASQFIERISPGAATRSIATDDVLALHEHDLKMLLGRTSSGTLRLFDGPDALRYEIDLPDTAAGRDVAALLERGDIKGSSFGFRATNGDVKWTRTADGQSLRTVNSLKLRDISTTCQPAYADSTEAELLARHLGRPTSLHRRPAVY